MSEPLTERLRRILEVLDEAGPDGLELRQVNRQGFEGTMQKGGLKNELGKLETRGLVRPHAWKDTWYITETGARAL